jgi:ABC-type branched-subunit amino acid transport system ATPase component
MSLLSVRNLARRHGGNLAVDDVSFDVMPGEILGVMGANGAGKTTLFSMIAGNVKPSSGQIMLEGQAIHGQPPEHINALGVARTFQIVRPFPGMSVLENVAVGAMYGRGRIRSPAAAREHALALLRATGLADRADLPASQLNLAGRKRLEIARALATRPRPAAARRGAGGERRATLAGLLSGGEQQMLALARGLMSMPRVLLLDEPSLGLAPAMADEVFAALRSIRAQGVTIGLVEQSVYAALSIADSAYVMEDGHVVRHGPSASLIDDPMIRQAYLGL